MIDIKNKKISIIGAEESGISAALLAKRNGAAVFLSDAIEKPERIPFLTENKIKYEFGCHSDNIYDCDIFVTSPGVPDHSEVLKKANKLGITIYSEIEFASWFTRSPIIAITGTNGKSTTTALTQHLLNSCGKRSIAAGNIGYGFSNYADNGEDDTIFVIEVSSFQLDHIKSFHPKVATIMNITPDHLDRYEEKLENYISSKFQILKNMDQKDIFIRNIDDDLIMKNETERNISKVDFSVFEKVENGAYLKEDFIYLAQNGKSEKLISKNDIFIKGNHNIANCLVGILASKYFGVENNLLVNGLKSFKGLEHRCEFVRELKGVKYINDSKATNIESTIVALKSYENPLILILGGREHGNDYNKILDLVRNNVKKIIAIGETQEKIYEFFSPFKEVIKCSNFSEAILSSHKISHDGDVVLFSPACKSFDWFNNYKHRGEEFKKLVNELE